MPALWLRSRAGRCRPFWQRESWPRVPLSSKASPQRHRVPCTSRDSRPTCRLPPGVESACHQPPVHLLDGQWQRINEGVGIFQGRGGAIRVPARVFGSYEVEFEFTRLEGQKALGAIFPVAARHCLLSLGEGETSGFELISGQGALANGTARASRIINGQKHVARLRVQVDERSADLQIHLDGEAHLHWQGSWSELSLPHERRSRTGELQVFAFGSAPQVVFHAVRLRTNERPWEVIGSP